MAQQESDEKLAAGDPADATQEEAQNSIAFCDPHDLPFWRKVIMTASLAGITFTVTFASSIFSSTVTATAEEFNTTTTVMILGVSLYVLGFAVGPLFWGPVSEAYGRRIPIFSGYAVFGLLQIPTALAKSLSSLLVLRFLAGSFGSAPLVLVTAAYADFWGVAARGTASAIYATTTFMGPTCGPIVGVYVVAELGWRWTAWLTGILALGFGIPAFILVPETYLPVLKKEPKPQFKAFLSKYLVRPVLMLRHEILLDVMTLYVSITYGIQYLLFYSIPHIFRHDRQWPTKTASLPFIALLLGIMTSAISVSIFYSKWLQPRYIARGKVLPEDRLPPIILGSLLLPVGLFWLAWTSHVHWIAQVIPIFFLGCGIMLVFAVSVVYIIDIYLPVSASALAANTAIRSVFAAGLPLAAPVMYEKLGTAGATSLLGGLTVLLIPAPILFHRYGDRLRQTSKFAVG